ncbi:hypothetical protein Ancab_001544 [Ancistrocladus abbreviatus]
MAGDIAEFSTFTQIAVPSNHFRPFSRASSDFGLTSSSCFTISTISAHVLRLDSTKSSFFSETFRSTGVSWEAASYTRTSNASFLGDEELRIPLASQPCFLCPTTKNDCPRW